MSTDSNIAILCITENGQNLAIKIENVLGYGDIYYIKNKSEDSILEVNIKPKVKIIRSRVKVFVEDIFSKYEYIVFIMATGIVVRSIAELINSKFSDPAILVIDEQGKNVISLLSGHMGGANEMTLKISSLINANPVITTATDVNKKSSLDMISKKLYGHIDDFRDTVKDINSMIVNNKPVGLYIDGEYEVDTRGFVIVDKEEHINELEKIVVITNKKEFIDDQNIHYSNKFVKLTPKDIVVGIGCRKDIDSKDLQSAFIDFLNTNNIDIKSIKRIGSIEIKKHEQAIVDLGNYLGVPFETISCKEISTVDYMFDKSEWVKKNVGVYSVAEPVAYLLSGGNIIIKKQKYNGITFSMGRERI